MLARDGRSGLVCPSRTFERGCPPSSTWAMMRGADRRPPMFISKFVGSLFFGSRTISESFYLGAPPPHFSPLNFFDSREIAGVSCGEEDRTRGGNTSTKVRS